MRVYYIFSARILYDANGEATTAGSGKRKKKLSYTGILNTYEAFEPSLLSAFIISAVGRIINAGSDRGLIVISTSLVMRILKIGLEWFINPDHTPFFVAKELGWFKEEGLEIELIEPKAHMDPMDDICAGRLDIAITEPLHVVSDRAEGQKVIGFARFLHTNGGVMYLKGQGINRPRDMNKAGLRIQYPGAPGALIFIQEMLLHPVLKELFDFRTWRTGYFIIDD